MTIYVSFLTSFYHIYVLFTVAISTVPSFLVTDVCVVSLGCRAVCNGTCLGTWRGLFLLSTGSGVWPFWTWEWTFGLYKRIYWHVSLKDDVKNSFYKLSNYVITRGGTTIVPQNFSHKLQLQSQWPIAYIEGISFTKFRLFFQMRETLYAGCVNSILRHRELFTQAAFQLVAYRETASSKCIFQGIKKMKLGGY